MAEQAAAPAASPASSAPPGESWYSLSPEAVAQKLQVDPAAGLSAAAAADLLQKNGPNALAAEKAKPGWRRFLDEYTSYMQIILVSAAAVSLVVGELRTALMLIVLTVLNAVIGLREEGKAESAMNALRSMLKATARVRRDGAEAEIPAEEVVAGDTILLAAGDSVPADGRIIEASSLQIDESALTGESAPVAKGAAALSGSGLNAADQTNMAFMNSPVTHGSGELLVTGTGADTQVGRISSLLTSTKKEQTPLQKQLDTMTLWIGAAALVAMVVMFALGMARGQEWKVLFVTAVALAIAAIPEALPTVVEVILSLGAVDLAKRHAIVKDLASVETLGSTSAINSDKTGTLTMNQMTAVELYDASDHYTIAGSGYSLDGAIQHPVGASASMDDFVVPFVVASDAKLEAGKVVGDPTEGALLVLAHKAGLSVDGTRDKYPRLATLPFDPTYKLMATFNKATDSAGKDVVRCFVKGAAPAVMQRAATTLANGSVVAIDDDLTQRARAIVERMENEGLRVMAAAYRDLDAASFDPDGDLLAYIADLTVASLVGMIDPPREESRAAVAASQAAHIRVRMVTGDDLTTGAAIARQLGIPGEAILGADFAALSDDERLARIDAIGVVGRVAPEHKAILVETLKKRGDVVAMTGDGVNDAPAIKAADIGIAMGSGTEVAKNASRMILQDDDFATIVFAVEQGRKLYDNLAKYVRFILITLVGFVLTFLGASIFNIAAGEPFTPVQILWINFLIDMPLGIALGFDKETPGLMLRRPRPRTASILTRSVLFSSALVGVFMAVVLLALITYGERHAGGAVAGVSMALTAFAFFRIVGTFESRSLTGSVFRVATFDCRPINLIVIAEVVLAFLATQWEVLRSVLGTAALSERQWWLSVAPALALLLLWEIGKLVARRASKDAPVHESAGAAAPARAH